MKKTTLLKSLTASIVTAICFGICVTFPLASPAQTFSPAQAPAVPSSDAAFRIGEKLTYTVAFERFSNVAYAELHTVSRGRIGDADAVELRSKFKTLNFVSAAFYLIDESRTVFAAPDTGVPLYISKIQNVGGLPKEIIQNNLLAPVTSFDLVTLIYKVRHSSGTGAATILEGDKVFNATFQTTLTERVKTDAGEFDSSVVSVQSEYFTEIGLKDVRVNFSTDESKIPVLIKFKTAKGEFRLSLASIQNLEPQAAEPQATPTPIKPVRALPTPTPTPRPYVDNQALGSDLSFELGEALEYGISSNGLPVGRFVLQAKERKQILEKDSLLLTATVTGVEPGNSLFNLNDYIRAQVDPETLGPRQGEINFTGTLSNRNQTLVFDEKTGKVTLGGMVPVDSPIGTHSILSLIYAMRSFNLKPSKDTLNPVNDTRVAVFWETKPYIFTLRPSNAEIITLQGEKISAQMVSINTAGTSPQIDALNIKVWLSNDNKRVPLRINLGAFQADLVSNRNIMAK